MTRVPRLALYALLVLIQVLAPWVHAHTSRETGGFLHMPGLETLAHSGKAFAAEDFQAGGADVIVGMQAGVPHGGSEAQCPSDSRGHSPALPASLIALLPAPQFERGWTAKEAPPPRCRHGYVVSAPRAPPSGLFRC
jgi:hypothetical protein